MVGTPLTYTPMAVDTKYTTTVTDCPTEHYYVDNTIYVRRPDNSNIPVSGVRDLSAAVVSTNNQLFLSHFTKCCLAEATAFSS